MGIVVNSDYIKIIVASYYRYQRGYYYTCTEWDNMDVCACDGNNVIEIECKISKSDLKKELKSITKIEKHKSYSELNFKKANIPNKYYIAMTSEMCKDKECLEIVNKLNNKYGIIEITDNKYNLFKFKKNAKKLHNKNISERQKKTIMNRLSSENILLRRKLYEQKNKCRLN